jgi:hypothetical protein
MRHRKIVCEKTKVGSLVHGDYYRYTAGDGAVPLIIYIGGATSAAEYLARLNTEPAAILDEFGNSWEAAGSPAADLLILPCPPVEEGGEPTFRQDFFATLLFNILPATDNPRPPSLGVVGYSLGASLGTFVTLGLAGAKRLATLGGYAMAEAGRESPCVGGADSRSYKSICGFDDRAYMENLSFAMFLKSHDIDLKIEMRPGGHEFADYAANGAVKDAFRFLFNGILG